MIISIQISRFQLASCYEEAGQIDKAIATWKDYLSREPADSRHAFKARQHLESLQTQTLKIQEKVSEPLSQED